MLLYFFPFFSYFLPIIIYAYEMRQSSYNSASYSAFNLHSLSENDGKKLKKATTKKKNTRKRESVTMRLHFDLNRIVPTKFRYNFRSLISFLLVVCVLFV